MMKRNQTQIALLSVMLFIATPLWASTTATDCSKPAVLRVTKPGTDLYFQLNENAKHKLFALGEVSNAAISCSPDRMIFVVADTNVSPMEMLLPGKEQITSVRYFVQLKTGDVIELSFGSIFRTLPLNPSVKGSPLSEDGSPPPSTNRPKGSK